MTILICPFKDCDDVTESLSLLLEHVRSGHGAIAWSLGTLVAAMKRGQV